jgi:hypothetical protein
VRLTELRIAGGLCLDEMQANAVAIKLERIACSFTLA